MCNEDAAGLKDPPTNRPIRERTKLNHTSGILHMRFKDWKCPGHTNHKQIEGQTKMRLADGTWKSINTKVFAGWYTRKFCDNVIQSFEEEFKMEEEAKITRPVHDSNTVLPVMKPGRGLKIPPGKVSPLGQKYFRRNI